MLQQVRAGLRGEAVHARTVATDGIVGGGDSWITDAHKWLNVPYDSALVLCADAEAHRAAMTVSASYLIQDDARLVRNQVDWVPEFSRRARGFAVYAALRSLGRSGLVELVERTCACARRFAEGIIELSGVELRAIRVSVSNWQTEDEEIDLALESFRSAALQSPAHAPAR